MFSTQHAIGWLMFAAIAITCAASITLIFWLEMKHPHTFVQLGGRRICWSAQFGYLGFLWQFRYLSLRDPVVIALAIVTQVGSVTALYLIYKLPSLYFWSGP